MIYRFKYYKSYLRYIFSLISTKFSNTSDPEIDLIFVIPEESRGWILEAICKEIEAVYPGKCAYSSNVNSLESSKKYFFAHYYWLHQALQRNYRLWGKESYVLYTHPKQIMKSDELIYILNKIKKTFSLCSLNTELLIKCGLQKERVETVLGAASPDDFKFHNRSSDGYIGLSTAFYDRKDPDRIFNIIQKMQHRKFMLLGRNWEKYHKFDSLTKLNNFTYLDIPYSDYPSYYEKMSVFLSVSRIEGGPFPLIETMMSNIFPVCSNTGFARDIIRHGENGFIFDIDSSSDHICTLLDNAFNSTVNVRDTVLHLSWNNFAHKIIDEL